jgi:hypothetical protein
MMQVEPNVRWEIYGALAFVGPTETPQSASETLAKGLLWPKADCPPQLRAAEAQQRPSSWIFFPNTGASRTGSRRIVTNVGGFRRRCRDAAQSAVTSDVPRNSAFWESCGLGLRLMGRRRARAVAGVAADSRAAGFVMPRRRRRRQRRAARCAAAAVRSSSTPRKGCWPWHRTDLPDPAGDAW